MKNMQRIFRIIAIGLYVAGLAFFFSNHFVLTTWPLTIALVGIILMLLDALEIWARHDSAIYLFVVFILLADVAEVMLANRYMETGVIVAETALKHYPRNPDATYEEGVVKNDMYWSLRLSGATIFTAISDEVSPAPESKDIYATQSFWMLIWFGLIIGLVPDLRKDIKRLFDWIEHFMSKIRSHAPKHP